MRTFLCLRDAIKKIWSGYWQDDCLILSAAVSFYAIFSVIPFVFLLFVIWGFFVGSSDTLYGQIDQFAKELVPKVPPEVMEDILDQIKIKKPDGQYEPLVSEHVTVFEGPSHELAQRPHTAKQGLRRHRFGDLLRVGR